MNDIVKRDLILYERNGRCPYEDWIKNLKDLYARAIIRVRLDRLESGNLGITRSLGDGLYELKIYFGGGYRVYFGEKDKTRIVLLCGGDKGGQKRDIRRARKYWAEHRKGQNEEIP